MIRAANRQLFYGEKSLLSTLLTKTLNKQQGVKKTIAILTFQGN